MIQGIAYTKENIYVVFAGRVFVIDAKPLYEMMPRPFHIEPVQSTMVLKGKAPKVTYSAPGATSIKLELRAFKGGKDVVLESPDGQFTIDMSHIDEIAEKLWERLQGGSGANNDPRTNLQEYLKLTTEAYQRITSKKPSGVPIAVTADVSAQGPNLKSSVLSHVYLIDIPQSVIRRAVPSSNTRPSASRIR